MGDAGGLRVSPVLGSGATPPPEVEAPGAPPPEADTQGWLMSALADRGISRRRFLGFADRKSVV